MSRSPPTGLNDTRTSLGLGATVSGSGFLAAASVRSSVNPGASFSPALLSVARAKGATWARGNAASTAAGTFSRRGRSARVSTSTGSLSSASDKAVNVADHASSVFFEQRAGVAGKRD
jgi:hypothetical protein